MKLLEKDNCEGCQDKGYLDETDGYDYGKVVCPVCVNNKEPNQETLEEDPEQWLQEMQAERMYSRQDLIEFVYFLNDRHFNKYIVDTDEVDLFIEEFKKK
jgi:hypothetical protein